MSIKRLAYLPLATYPEPVDDDTVIAAVDLAGNLDAELHVTTYAVDIPRVTTPIGGLLVNIPEMIGAAEAKSRSHCERLAGLLSGKAAARGTKHHTKVSAPGLIGEKAATEARYFDLAILPWAKDDPVGQEIAQSVLFGSGRPAILLPQHPPRSFKHFAIAWDGGRVAARALADALQLATPESRITVVTITDEKSLAGDDIARMLADALALRGLKAEVANASLNRRAIGEALQETAIEAGADLLVMGGYGHSRIRDFVLGGATRNILSDLRLPVLLSH